MSWWSSCDELDFPLLAMWADVASIVVLNSENYFALRYPDFVRCPELSAFTFHCVCSSVITALVVFCDKPVAVESVERHFNKNGIFLFFHIYSFYSSFSVRRVVLRLLM